MTEQPKHSAEEKAFANFLAGPSDKRGTTRYQKLFRERFPGGDLDRLRFARDLFSEYQQFVELFEGDDDALFAGIYLCERGANVRRLCSRLQWLSEAMRKSDWESIIGERIDPRDVEALNKKLELFARTLRKSIKGSIGETTPTIRELLQTLDECADCLQDVLKFKTA